MNEYGIKSKDATVASLGLKNVAVAYWNLNPAELVEETIVTGQGMLTDTGALAVDTGKFTGRSPKDKFIVCDAITENSVWWGDINIKFTPKILTGFTTKLLLTCKAKKYMCATATPVPTLLTV
jgi:phosphoenolpyruvate carboxykinase (ATP)